MPRPADAIAAVTHCNPYPWYASLRSGPALVFDPALRRGSPAAPTCVREVLANDALRVRPPAEPVPRAIAGTPAGELFGRLVRMNDGAPHGAHKPVLQRALAGLDLARGACGDAAGRRGHAAHALSEPASRCRCAVAHLLGFADRELPQRRAMDARFRRLPLAAVDRSSAGAGERRRRRLMDRFEGAGRRTAGARGSLLAAVQADSAGARCRKPCGRTSSACCRRPARPRPGCWATAWSRWRASRACAERSATAGAAALAGGRSRAPRSRDPQHAPLRRRTDHRRRPASWRRARRVLLVLAAANRDPSLNPAPATFELMRADRRRLGFGHGRHACPGQALAGTVAAAGLAGAAGRAASTPMRCCGTDGATVRRSTRGSRCSTDDAQAASGQRPVACEEGRQSPLGPSAAAARPAGAAPTTTCMRSSRSAPAKAASSGPSQSTSRRDRQLQQVAASRSR